MEIFITLNKIIQLKIKQPIAKKTIGGRAVSFIFTFSPIKFKKSLILFFTYEAIS